MYRDLVAVFCITALFDVALNMLPPPMGKVLLRDYFSKHTALAAALLAGFIGAFTLPVIRLFADIARPTVRAALAIFAVSALIGFPMQHSGLFPHLTAHYYEKRGLPRYQSFLADGLSGLLVASVYWAVFRRYDRHSARATTVMWLSIAVCYAALAKRGVIVTALR